MRGDQLHNSDVLRMTPDQLRASRSWRQAGLAAGVIDPKQMLRVSREVRVIDARLRELGERAW